MKKFLPLLLCLLLSIFTMARATKPAHTPVPDTKTAQNKPRGQHADAKTLLNDASTDGQVDFDDDDDSTAAPSDNEGQDVKDNGGGDAPDDQNTGDDDAGDDNGGDDGGGDEGK